MQDYNYVQAGCMEIYLIVDYCLFPSEEALDKIWLDNKEALLAFLETAHMGKYVHYTREGFLL